MIIQFLAVIFIVGIVTAGLTIRFDRFFTILLLLFIFGMDIKSAIDVFLWVIMLGALMVILQNKSLIAKIPKKKKIKLFVMIPIFTLIASLIGSLLFIRVSPSILLITLGILAILYGLRLMIIHFQEHELKFEKGHPQITKACGLIGPWISGFFIGFIGTSLKPLKIPFAVKIGKMNIKEVYLGNTITTFLASSFAIVWHYVLSNNQDTTSYYQIMLLGMALWTGIHYIYEITETIFPQKWKKGFQILIGLILILVSVKIFLLI